MNTPQNSSDVTPQKRAANSKAEIERLTRELRRTIAYFNDVKIFADRPFRHQIDVSRILQVCDELIDESILAAFKQAAEHLKTGGGQ